MAELFLPVLSHFQNKNVWLASDGRLRFQITPGEGLAAEIWEGPWCYELSRVEETNTFPMDEEGIIALRAWLGQKAAEVNARPKRSMSENLERRVEPAAKEA